MMLVVSPRTKRAHRIIAACESEFEAHTYDAAEPDLGEVVRLIDEHETSVVVVGPGHHIDVACKLSAEITERAPFAGVLVFADDDPNAIRSAFRAGAADVLAPKLDDEAVARAIAEIENQTIRKREAEAARTHDVGEPARVITVLSPRGGVGRTLLASTIGLTLERDHPGEVVVVDLDLQNGDVSPMLGLAPNLSISSVVGREDDIDSADVKAILTKTETGLHILAAPPTLTSSVEVGPELVAAVLARLCESFRYVVVDTGTVLTEPALEAVDASTDLVLACAPDVPSVRALGRITDALGELNVVGPKRHLVVNKASDRYGMPLRDIEAVSGMSATAQIPAAKEIVMALNRGGALQEALNARGAVQRAMNDLVKALVPATNGSKKRRKWGFK